MAGMSAEFSAHVGAGLTTLCRCWAITRSDGEVYGFTDHDCGLDFDGISFKADTGLSAVALQTSTGLSVDNSEVLGALSDLAIREADVEAGRFDGAGIRAWLVNWADPDTRWLQFRGTIGELTRQGSAFRAELRGLTEMLNRPVGRIYQKPCAAVLGDQNCRFELNSPGYFAELAVEQVEGGRVFRWQALEGFEPGWFERGRLSVIDGAAGGLWVSVKSDRSEGGGRIIEAWTPLRADIAPGDTVRLLAGCDKRTETCRLKFNNLLNFQGFPDLPTEDWVMAVPKRSGDNSGGSLR